MLRYIIFLFVAVGVRGELVRVQWRASAMPDPKFVSVSVCATGTLTPSFVQRQVFAGVTQELDLVPGTYDMVIRRYTAGTLWSTALDTGAPNSERVQSFTVTAGQVLEVSFSYSPTGAVGFQTYTVDEPLYAAVLWLVLGAGVMVGWVLISPLET